MEKKVYKDPNLPKKRNFAKFRLAGIHATLKNLCGDVYYTKAPLLEEERTALISILKDITSVLSYWDENYKELRRLNNERKT